MKTTARVLSVLLVLVCLIGCLSMVTASAAPTTATVSTDKATYAVDETVTFTTSSDGTSNTLWIYRVDGQWQTYIQAVPATYTMAFGWAGEYKALVEAWDTAGGSCQSSMIYFTVGSAASSSKPTTATIGSDKSVYKIGDTVNFTMSGDGETNTLWVYSPSNPGGTYFQNAGTAYSYIPTEAGQYEALMETWNGVGSFCSERIKFRVVDPNAPVTTPKPTTVPPTDPPTNPPTNPPTDPPTNPPTNPPTEPPTIRPTNPPTTRPRPSSNTPKPSSSKTTTPTVTAPPLTTHPCASGHNYGSGGYCVNCYAVDPNYQPSINDFNDPTEPTANTNNGGSGNLFSNFWLWFWLAVVLFIVFVVVAIVLIIKRNNADDEAAE